MIPSNKTSEFKIQDDAERYVWATYHIIICISSYIGDSLILYASFQKDAFRLNKFIVTIVQHIAVSDIAYTSSSVLPGAISLIADYWVLGDILCYSRVYVGFLTYPLGLGLIAVLTTSKFILLKFPLRSAALTERRARVVCRFVLIPALLFPISFLVVDRDAVGFDYKTYVCDYFFRKSEVWEELSVQRINIIITLLVPNLIIMATTIPTLMYLAAARKSAKRVRGSVPWQGALTVALTAIACWVSTIPFIILFIMGQVGKVHPYFVRTAKFALMINIMSNFYIYALTIKSFRRFLLSKILSIEFPVSWKESRITLSHLSAGRNLYMMYNAERRIFKNHSHKYLSMLDNQNKF